MAPLPLPRGRSLALEPFALMGVVNATPDSFHAASRHRGALDARDAALALVAEGATVIDIGGESTRPGSEYVSDEEELERVVPAVEAIRAESDIPLSIDTRKESVIAAAVAAGADLLNDVSALRHSPGIAAFAARAGIPVVLMHMKGDPKDMQAAPDYGDCVAEVRGFLAEAAARARAAGIASDRIVLDPGIGFGKRLEHNLELLARLDDLASLGYPLLVGISRKSFVGAVTGRATGDRLAGSLGAAAAAWHGGARVFRVHDVAPTRDLLLLLSAIAASRKAAG